MCTYIYTHTYTAQYADAGGEIEINRNWTAVNAAGQGNLYACHGFENMPRNSTGAAELQLYHFFNLGTRRGWVVNAMPFLLYPGRKTRYRLYRGGTQGKSRGMREISLPPGFDPR